MYQSLIYHRKYHKLGKLNSTVKKKSLVKTKNKYASKSHK